jgi:hypothetical protein
VTTASLTSPAPPTRESAAWEPKISRRQMSTVASSPRLPSPAAPTEATTSIKLPAITPAQSSPMAASTTDSTTPNRITLEPRL